MELKLDNLDWINRTIEDCKNNPDKYEMPLTGENDDGELIMFEVHPEYVLLITYQSNGWCRKNYYYMDGTVEELFER